MPPETMIAMKIILPLDILDKSTATVNCWGQVVRRDAFLTEKYGHPVLAAVILRYRFIHD